MLEINPALEPRDFGSVKHLVSEENQGQIILSRSTALTVQGALARLFESSASAPQSLPLIPLYPKMGSQPILTAVKNSSPTWQEVQSIHQSTTDHGFVIFPAHSFDISIRHPHDIERCPLPSHYPSCLSSGYLGLSDFSFCRSVVVPLPMTIQGDPTQRGLFMCRQANKGDVVSVLQGWMWPMSYPFDDAVVAQLRKEGFYAMKLTDNSVFILQAGSLGAFINHSTGVQATAEFQVIETDKSFFRHQQDLSGPPPEPQSASSSSSSSSAPFEHHPPVTIAVVVRRNVQKGVQVTVDYQSDFW